MHIEETGGQSGMKITFEIPGIPIAQGRARLSTRGGFPRLHDTERSISFKNLVTHIAGEERKLQGLPFFEGALQAHIYCYFPIPKSKPKKFREGAKMGTVVHISRPDCDNLAKSILDACNQVLYKDDSQISSLHVYKLYAEIPKTVVTIENWSNEA